MKHTYLIAYQASITSYCEELKRDLPNTALGNITFDIEGKITANTISQIYKILGEKNNTDSKNIIILNIIKL